jgi:hypothetical protein
MKRKGWLLAGALVVLALSTQIQSCAKKDEGSSSSVTYSTTGTTGDYAEWTVSGSTLTAVWKVMNGTGAITKTLNVSATCGAADATFGYKACTVDSGSCTAESGSSCAADDAPSAGKQFYMFEVPGVALVVKGKTESGTPAIQEQLHVGLLKDTSCASIAGDYTFMMTGLKKRDLFGIYRTDSDFNNITHADFGMDNGGTAATTPSVIYTTGSTGGIETLTGSGCVDGVRTRGISGSTIRLAATAAGAFIVDMPAGQGGLVAFKTTNAASISDLAGKSFGGIKFPDDGSAEEVIAVTTGALASGSVPITNVAFSGGTSATNFGHFRPVTYSGSWTASAPAYPNFSSVPSAYSSSSNALKTTYANPSTIPGMFVIDSGSFGDTGRVFMVAMKYNGKVMAFGTTYNHRNTNESGAPLDNIANTGAFIVFEK